MSCTPGACGKPRRVSDRPVVNGGFGRLEHGHASVAMPPAWRGRERGRATRLLKKPRCGRPAGDGGRLWVLQTCPRERGHATWRCWGVFRRTDRVSCRAAGFRVWARVSTEGSGVRCGRGWVVIGGLCAAVLAVSSRGQTTGAALRRACDQLVATQLEVGVNAGAWPEETAFTGTMAAGLAWAYQRTCEPMYLQAAERAAGFISRVSGIYYGYGDDAWAMLLLSEASADRWDNPYRANLAAFYEGVREMEGGTAGFIASYGTGTEPSTAVLYLAMHCVASDYVGATDAEMFRAAVRDFLAGVDDATASWPVLALGAATWALAETGPLDGGLVDPSGTGRPMWNLVRLEDLPGMLLGHQVVEGLEGADGADAAIAGAFYWRFDHTDGGDGEGVVAGFTEDTVFGAMGLAAAARRWGDPVLGAASDRSLRVLVGVVDAEGRVGGHLWEPSPVRAVYAGELAAALAMLAAGADTNLDDVIDLADVRVLASGWLEPCDDGCRCGEADVNDDGRVDLEDLAAMASGWLGEG